MHRRVLILAAITALLGPSASVAMADTILTVGSGSGEARPGTGTVDIGAINATPVPSGGSAPGSLAPAAATPASWGGAGSGSPAVPACTLTPDPSAAPGPGQTGLSYAAGQSGFDQVPFAAPGTWYLSSCLSATSLGTVFVPAAQSGGGAGPAPAPVPVISPAQLAEIAKNQIQLVAPPLQLSPAAGVNQIVHVPTWAWLPPAAFAALHATAAAGPVVVTATASPTTMAVSYTDGGASRSVTCTGPGTPYSDALAAQEDPASPIRAASPDCGWTFENSSAAAPGERVPVSATVTYEVTWTVTGAAGGGDLGPLTSPPAVFAVQVAEIEAIITH